MNSKDSELALKLGEFGHDLFTLVPVDRDAAIFGLLDKFLGPSAIESVKRQGRDIVVHLPEPGDFGAFLQKPPRGVKVDGRTLSPSGYSYSGRLLRIPRASFGNGSSEHEVEIVLPN